MFTVNNSVEIEKYEVTIVIPIYNVEQYLEECLESVIRQTFQSYEVLLINDGSTDRSGDIAELYTKKNKHFRIVHQKNKGLSAARNKGVSMARGKYICFIDADDYVHEDYLEKLYRAVKRYNADMAISDYYEVDEQGGVIAKENESCFYKEGLVDKKIWIQALTITGKCHYATVAVVAWNKLIRTEIMRKHLFPEGVYHEDEFVAMPLIISCDKIVWVSKTYYCYRQREKSIMRTRQFSERYYKVLDAYENRIQLCVINGFEGMYEKFVMSYIRNLTIQYALMMGEREKSREAGSFYMKRMRIALRKYGTKLDKKTFVKCVMFGFAPNYYIRRFLGVR